jgi:hypothetical protein
VTRRERLPGVWLGDTSQVSAAVIDTAALMPVPDTEPYGTCCGHGRNRHRGGRCWTGFDGGPVSRKKALIDCTCRAYEEDE